MNLALLRDGAERPDGFWLRFAVNAALRRLKLFGVVALLPIAIFGGVYWNLELGDKASNAALAGAVAASCAGGALLHLLIGAALDLVTQTSRFGAVYQREVLAYFHTPVPYLVLVLFTLASGFFFYATLTGRPVISFRPLFQAIASFLIFLIPLLTIRTFAEERASGTVEPLLTAPVTEAQVVAGKFMGAMTFFAVMLIPTVAYFVVLRFIGAEIGKPDAGPVILGYVGMLLFGAFHIAIGIFASTLTQDTILGAFMAFVLTLFFWVVQPLMEAKQLIDTQYWNEAAAYLAPTTHLDPFLKGLLSPVDAIYFLSFMFFFLFLSVRLIEYRKWR